MNSYRITYRMEVNIEAETQEEAQTKFDNCNIQEEYNPEYIEQVSIELWDENINPAQPEPQRELTAEETAGLLSMINFSISHRITEKVSDLSYLELINLKNKLQK